MIHCQIPDCAHDNPRNDIRQNQECKILLCLIRFLLPHLFHDDRAAAGGKHGGDCRDELDNGRRQIDCRESVCPDQVRHKQSVNHRIKRHKYRHCNRWHGKFQDVFQCDRLFIYI